jgi:hypothetical protein
MEVLAQGMNDFDVSNDEDDVIQLDRLRWAVGKKPYTA